MGWAYLIHFDRPVCSTRPAQHYVGYAEELAKREREHHGEADPACPLPEEHRRAQLEATETGRPQSCRACRGWCNPGAKILHAANLRGIGWRVVEKWEGGKGIEVQIKRRRNHRQLCPICSAARVIK